MLFLLSLFPWFRHDSARGQPLFSAGNIHVAGRCSDYRFFIDHLHTGRRKRGEFSSLSFDIPFISLIHKEMDIYLGTVKERSWCWEFESKKVERHENGIWSEFRRILETLEALDEEWKDVWEKISDEGIQIATIKQIILHFPADISSHCRSRIEIWKMGGLTRRLGQEFLAWNFERNATRLVRAPQKEESEIRGR